MSSPEWEALKHMQQRHELAERIQAMVEKRRVKSGESTPERKAQRRVEQAAEKAKKRRRKQGRR